MELKDQLTSGNSREMLYSYETSGPGFGKCWIFFAYFWVDKTGEQTSSVFTPVKVTW